MKRTQNNLKKNAKKTTEVKSNQPINKKTTSIQANNNTLLNFFKINSIHKSTSTVTDPPQRRQVTMKLSRDATESQQNYRLSKYKFYGSKKKKTTNVKKFLKKKSDEEKNKIDVSNYILFSEKYVEKINDIFANNFLRNFKRYLESNFLNDRKNIGPRQDLNISKNSFNKFIQHIFKHFITKYLLSSYKDLIYISEKYFPENNQKNDYTEVELLSYKDKSNINLEYSPMNLSECNLFYPELSSVIVKFIKNFRKKKRYKKPNHALLLYRPNNDFTTYINKIRLICDQMGYNLLIKEDETNKLMTFEKLKLINQNYIIGSLKDKNKKYLQIIDNISNTEKWPKFLESNNIDINNNISESEYEDKTNNKSKSKNTKNKIRNTNVSKSQSTINTTQDFSKRILQNKNKNNNNNNDILSNTILTFIGHSSSNEVNVNESDKINNSKEYLLSRNYQQNILEKFNKRKNVILFVDNFEESEENIKYIYQINSIIPNSKSPIIILTDNLPLFTNNLIIGNTSFQTRYIPHQIENEGIIQKENVIYITFLIIYFTSFFPKAVLEKQNLNNKNDNNKNEDKDNNKEKEEKDKDNPKDKELENELDFVINISDTDSINMENYDYNLDKIKKAINDIFIDIDLNLYNNKLYGALISLSYIISLINNYELDNILVYLKNLFQIMDVQLKSSHVKPTTQNTLSLLIKTILEDIEEYQMDDDITLNSEINNNEDDIYKLNEICENNSFLDYEYGYINKVGEKDYEFKMRNFGINKGIDYNKESYFYLNEFYYGYGSDKISKNKIFNYISNIEIQDRIIEDHKFYQNYYNSNIILNYLDIIKINMILTQIILNERIALEDTSKFIGTRYSKRKNFRNQNAGINDNNFAMNEKISVLNKIFKKCPLEHFNKYINAHIGVKYYVEFIIDNKKYCIPDKLIFYNYYNVYYLMEQIQSEQKNKYIENDEDEDDNDDDISEDEEPEFDEEDEY